MLATIANQLVDCADHKAPLTIFSAHDTTVFSLLAALGATPVAELPDFTAHIIAQLLLPGGAVNMDELQVKLTYNDMPLTGLSFCPEGQCTLGGLLKATKGLAMTKDECKAKRNKSDKNDTTHKCCPIGHE